MLSYLVVGRENNQPTILHAWLSLTVEGAITFNGEISQTRDREVVVAIGVRDHLTRAQTEGGRRQRKIALIQRFPTLIPETGNLSVELSAKDCTEHAVQWVDAARERQSAIPRPSWWPASAPLLSEPVFSQQV
jgi:hypothetical protein